MESGKVNAHRLKFIMKRQVNSPVCLPTISCNIDNHLLKDSQKLTKLKAFHSRRTLQIRQLCRWFNVRTHLQGHFCQKPARSCFELCHVGLVCRAMWWSKPVSRPKIMHSFQFRDRTRYSSRIIPCLLAMLFSWDLIATDPRARVRRLPTNHFRPCCMAFCRALGFHRMYLRNTLQTICKRPWVKKKQLNNNRWF